MRTTYHQPVVPEAEEAAEQIPKNRGKIRLEPASRKEKLIEAGILLVTMFDQAMVRANRARARAGWAAAISLRQQPRGARCYFAPAQHGGERTLVLFIALPLLDGDLFGGAYIRPSQAHSAIYVVPVIDAETPRWLVQASESELTTAVIDDLFQSTFSDDGDAATRLAPHYGFDLFTTPWS